MHVACSFLCVRVADAWRACVCVCVCVYARKEGRRERRTYKQIQRKKKATCCSHCIAAAAAGQVWPGPTVVHSSSAAAVAAAAGNNPGLPSDIAAGCTSQNA